LICNSSNLGWADLVLSSDVSVHDGLLDVFVLRQADLSGLLAVVRDVLTKAEPNAQALQHWQGRAISVVAEPNQTVQADGEVLGQTPITVRVLPGAIKVLVPSGAKALEAS
jgi:diacylglycerol kinase family enzyme